MNLFNPLFKQLFCATFILFLLIGNIWANVVYIYDDEGVCKESVRETLSSFKNELAKSYQIKTINAEKIIRGEWVNEASLLVIPGGRATPYAQLLNGEGNRLIRSFVEQGGSYLGICAGAYYGGARVEFAMGTDMEINTIRELGFFPATIVGPALGFDYRSAFSTRIANIEWKVAGSSSANKAVLYYNGGGFFPQVKRFSHIEIIATYENRPSQDAAIIKIPINEGMVVLSGVHFEYDTTIFKQFDFDNKSAFAEKYEEERKKLLRHILLNLKLQVRE